MFPVKDDIPLARFPLVTVALIALNVSAYLLATLSGHGGSFFGGPSVEVARHYGAVPHTLAHSSSLAHWKTAVTSLFVHGSFLHLLGNMAFLAIFGPAVEDATGRLRFPAFYLLGGLLALGVQIAVEPNSGIPVLGSSGAIAAVLGGYLLLHPRARVISLVVIPFMFTLVDVPAVLLLALWLPEQLYIYLAGLASAGAGAGGDSASELVGYLTHVGCVAFGLLAVRLFSARRSSEPPLLAVY
jgi:membrane associated rhomboid family serine protease